MPRMLTLSKFQASRDKISAGTMSNHLQCIVREASRVHCAEEVAVRELGKYPSVARDKLQTLIKYKARNNL